MVAKTPEEVGAIKRKQIINGICREWYEFIPDSVKSDRSRKTPLLFSFGGYACPAANFMAASKWYEVAEARGFIVIFPEPFPQPDPSQRVSREIVEPAWNVWDKKEYPSDINFTLEMIKDIKTRNNIDESRIYSTGHSLGGIMTQVLGLMKPELFAAIAPCSSNLNPGYLALFKAPNISKENIIPINLFGGEFDFAGGELRPSSFGKATVMHWLIFNRIPAGTLPELEQDKKFNYYIYLSSDNGFPLLTYTLIKKAEHEFDPETAWKIWDDFLSKFRRNSDGSVNYFGN